MNMADDDDAFSSFEIGPLLLRLQKHIEVRTDLAQQLAQRREEVTESTKRFYAMSRELHDIINDSGNTKRDNPLSPALERSTTLSPAADPDDDLPALPPLEQRKAFLIQCGKDVRAGRGPR
eukprot:Sspe_Gene.96647::Locus_69605_Transcript_1_1_Confidence_1.000_Length_426::g.96647::m.96647